MGAQRMHEEGAHFIDVHLQAKPKVHNKTTTEVICLCLQRVRPAYGWGAFHVVCMQRKGMRCERWCQHCSVQVSAEGH